MSEDALDPICWECRSVCTDFVIPIHHSCSSLSLLGRPYLMQFFFLSTTGWRKDISLIPPSKHSQCWWWNSSPSGIVLFRHRAFPTSRKQWLLLAAVATSKKTKVGCIEVNCWIDCSTTSLHTQSEIRPVPAEPVKFQSFYGYLWEWLFIDLRIQLTDLNRPTIDGLLNQPNLKIYIYIISHLFLLEKKKM